MFLHGCNYPWSTDGHTIFYGLDFGGNVWGSHLGVSTRRAQVARDFEEMAALGFTVARWFVFCDGRAGIAYDDRGLPTGPDAHLFDDLDAALEIARDTGIRLVLVALDHRWMFDGVRDTIADPVSGVILEARLPTGRAHILLEPEGHDALFNRVLVPMLRRYGPEGVRRDLAPHVLAWEFMNEPDWVIEEWERDVSSHVGRPLPFQTAAWLVARFSAAVHLHTSAVATLGGGRVRNMWAWDDEGLGLDLLQVHHYPDTRHPKRDDDPYGLSAKALGLGHPLILGEFPANGPEQHPPGASPPGITLNEYLEFAYRAGYVGAWPWSFSGTDAYGRLPVEPLRAFGRAHRDVVNPRFQP
jgi:hypothetical protein